MVVFGLNLVLWQLNGTLYPIDGMDIWGTITGGDAPEREWLPITEESLIWHSKEHDTTFKLITKARQTKWYLENGTQLPDTINEWPCGGGPPHPSKGDQGSNAPLSGAGAATAEGEHGSNAPLSGDAAAAAPCFVCVGPNPCLFDLLKDESERVNLARSMPAVVASMLTQKEQYRVYVHGDMSEHDLARYDCWGNWTGICNKG